ncbi:hypothetical protein O0I10_012086 [Lichtheimia ornata]|uniref:Uncharacterized protein n=1 Tax=Lichtheimia ornata TaxID=688661 RepID=A0AAD7USC6_9FUNG|nr:uncharacterized protein O0I10_012086 [Lichtheimia ornata]KAJ8652273.1 hypothetical protein O0I10_012086 [Lichtheimia ornata]
MTCVDWKKILHAMPATSTNDGNDDDDIMSATFDIQDLLHHIISKLSHRMHDLISIGNFEWALNDAAAIRTLDHSCFDGYLCAAKVYHQQDHHEAAIEICNEGLQMIHPSDPVYATLCSMVTKLPMEARVDFISSLPMDITSRIAWMIFTKGHPTKNPKQYPCLQVSKVWNKRLLEPYNALELHVVNSNGFDKWEPHIVRYGHHMTSLTIDGCTSPSYKLLEKTKFGSLTTLSIKDTPQDKDTYMMARLLRSLQQMPTTLTTLTIIAPTMLPIASILNSLPHLSSFECSSIAVDPIMLHSAYLKMETFKLRCTMYADYETASCILPRFPFLQTLLFDAITDRFPKILTQLPHWCPRLQHINLGAEHSAKHHMTPGGVTIILTMKDASCIMQQRHHCALKALCS